MMEGIKLVKIRILGFKKLPDEGTVERTDGGWRTKLTTFERYNLSASKLLKYCSKIIFNLVCFIKNFLRKVQTALYHCFPCRQIQLVSHSLHRSGEGRFLVHADPACVGSRA